MNYLFTTEKLFGMPHQIIPCVNNLIHKLICIVLWYDIKLKYGSLIRNSMAYCNADFLNGIE